MLRLLVAAFVGMSATLLAACGSKLPSLQGPLNMMGQCAPLAIHTEKYWSIWQVVGRKGQTVTADKVRLVVANPRAISGYAGLQHLIALRPSIIKLDRQFVDGIDRDEAKRALVEMVGTFADRTDCWLLAEGVERPEELDVLAKLGVPLGQGYLLGRPAPPWNNIDVGAFQQLAGLRGPIISGTLRDLVEANPSAPNLREAAATLAASPDLDVIVVLDHRQRPSGVADLESLAVGMASDAMRFNLDTPTPEAGLRAIGRPRQTRFQPLVCTDNAGRYAGVVRVERLIEQLSQKRPLPAHLEGDR